MRDLILLLQNIVGGVSIGAVYALVALGYSLIYRAMGLVNFAHGAIFMVGTYFGVTFYMGLLGLFRVPYPVAMAIGILLTALLGALLERIFRRIANLDLSFMLLGTIGVGIVLENTAALIWGTEGVAVPAPVSEQPINIGGVIILPQMVLIIVVAGILMVGLQFLLTRTLLGKAMRAAAQDREVAAAMGVPVNFTNALSFAIGGGLAAAAGILAAPLLYVNTTLSAVVGVKGFAAAILGGFGNLPGAIVGGLLFGTLESVGTQYISSQYKDGFAYILLAVLLMIRPGGILGEQTVQKV
jgi:branched-chain amino acid transport system permease protein